MVNNKQYFAIQYKIVIITFFPQPSSGGEDVYKIGIKALV